MAVECKVRIVKNHQESQCSPTPPPPPRNFEKGPDCLNKNTEISKTKETHNFENAPDMLNWIPALCGWWGGGFSTQYSHFLDSCCSSASRHRGTHHLPSSVRASIVHHGTMYCSVLPHAQMLSNFFMMPNTTDTITPLTITPAAR